MKNPIPIDPKIIPHIIVDGSIISPLSRQVDPIDNTRSDMVMSVGRLANRAKPTGARPVQTTLLYVSVVIKIKLTIKCALMIAHGVMNQTPYSNKKSTPIAMPRPRQIRFAIGIGIGIENIEWDSMIVEKFSSMCRK
jgi:hypothetical protein